MSAIEPVRKCLVVNAPQARAFRVFTAGIDRWWPREHHIGESPLKRAVLEERAGGRWYSECEDGTECDVGKVLGWDPPHRVLLAWQLTAEWKYDPDFVTEVEVVFTALGPRRTRVDFEHRNLERFGEKAEALRKSIEPGWGKMFAGYTSVAERAASEPEA